MTYDQWKLDNGDRDVWEIDPHVDDRFDTEEDRKLYQSWEASRCQ